MATRQYRQSLRARSADQTRRRILDALYEQLRAHPAEPIAIERIADAAEVARSTVYTAFGSRAGLFDALGADLLHRGGFGEMVQAVLQPDPRAGLRDGVRANATMYAAHRDVLRALYSMAELDADAVGGAVQRLEAGRAAGMSDLAQRLDQARLLRPELSVDDAADTLWLCSSFDAFDLLYRHRRGDVEQVAQRLVDVAETSICRDQV